MLTFTQSIVIINNDLFLILFVATVIITEVLIGRKGMAVSSGLDPLSTAICVKLHRGRRSHTQDNR